VISPGAGIAYKKPRVNSSAWRPYRVENPILTGVRTGCAIIAAENATFAITPASLGVPYNPQFLARSCSSATPQRSFLSKTLDVFGGGLGRHLRLALDHDADLLDYLGVGKRCNVANVHGIRDAA
jgi:hypothetical protein